MRLIIPMIRLIRPEIRLLMISIRAPFILISLHFTRLWPLIRPITQNFRLIRPTI